jgi:3-oxoadipate enol-lactonase
MRAIESSLNPSFPKGFRGESFEAYRLRWLTNAPGAMAALNRMLATMDHQAWCADPPCPTLMMGCSDDPFLPAKGVRALVEAIPGASYVELQAGHYPHLQAPEAFARAVAEFVTAH